MSEHRDMPKAPGAVIMSASGNFWVEESAGRVSEKLEDARGGVGTDDGLVEFIGLESTGKSGADGLTSFILRLNPMYIIGVRSMSQSSFENTIRAMQPPDLRSAWQSLFTVKDFGTPDDFDPEEKCRCGHHAGSHFTSSTVIGACRITGCDCTLFHAHREKK